MTEPYNDQPFIAYTQATDNRHHIMWYDGETTRAEMFTNAGDGDFGAISARILFLLLMGRYNMMPIRAGAWDIIKDWDFSTRLCGHALGLEDPNDDLFLHVRRSYLSVDNDGLSRLRKAGWNFRDANIPQNDWEELLQASLHLNIAV